MHLRIAFSVSFSLLAILAVGCATPQEGSGVRINEVQAIGSHNSYHVEPHPSVMALIAQRSPSSARSIEYTHPPLPQQFDQGIRQIELDIYPDPDGGRFAEPKGPAEARKAGLPEVPNHDPEGKLRKPGYKVLHAPDADYFTTVLTLKDALAQVRDWSRKNTSHFPIMILLELKGASRERPYTSEDLRALEEEILSVFNRSHILKPDDVRKGEPTLPDALRKHGWPTIEAARGKVMFALDNEDATREVYIKDATALQNKLLFVSFPNPVSAEPKRYHPAAGWMKMNEAIRDYDKIQQLVREGFLVRTRSDIPNVEVRANDTKRRDLAFSSGAQFLSTDYWRPNLKFSPYSARFEGGIVIRPNPVNGNTNLAGVDLEKIQTATTGSGSGRN